MAKKKKSRNQDESSIQPADVDSVGDGDQDDAAVETPEMPDVPAMPDMPSVPSMPDAQVPGMPPPLRTAQIKSFDLPPLSIGDDKPSDKGKGVLQGILERTQKEAEVEAAKLMDSLKVQQDAQRMARDEEDRRRAAEARARVEEERKKRDAALKEYEERQRRKEEAEAAKNRPAVHATVSIEQQKKASKAWIAVVAIAVVAVGGGVVGWKVMSGPAPVAFTVDSSIERAAGGSIVSTAVAYGPGTLRMGRPIDADMLVAGIAPEKYEAAAPVATPVVKKNRGGGGQDQKRIEIRTGIIGGKKVVR